MTATESLQRTARSLLAVTPFRASVYTRMSPSDRDKTTVPVLSAAGGKRIVGWMNFRLGSPPGIMPFAVSTVPVLLTSSLSTATYAPVESLSGSSFASIVPSRLRSDVRSPSSTVSFDLSTRLVVVLAGGERAVQADVTEVVAVRGPLDVEGNGRGERDLLRRGLPADDEDGIADGRTRPDPDRGGEGQRPDPLLAGRPLDDQGARSEVDVTSGHEPRPADVVLVVRNGLAGGVLVAREKALVDVDKRADGVFILLGHVGEGLCRRPRQ